MATLHDSNPELSALDYQAKYLAHLLTQRHPTDSTAKLAGALVDAQVDLNPHQVEAALFAFHSPFSKGALLADEVGLGKTIEAGLVISQRWAERKRRILVITPSNLRKQWLQELQEKFFLPSIILETKSYNQAVNSGNFSPFEPKDSIVICSFQFARAKAVDLHRVPWDLVVIDEAHRLRNVQKSVIAKTIKDALQRTPKILLTATPLQNSLSELFGLVSIIDDHAFGDLKSFQEQYSRLNSEDVYDVLKARLRPICHRTLRRQVTQYVSYTQRFPMVESFTPERAEAQLYDDVSEYLRRENLLALPSSQRTLMTLVLRKLLASSTFAIAGALDTVIRRMERKLKRQGMEKSLVEELDEDFEALDEIAEEWDEEADDEEQLTEEEIAALAQEVQDLRRFRDLAVSIHDNAKGKALLVALKKAFAEAQRLGAAHKAIIFTESRKTQDYLVRLLEQSEYADGIVVFNGSNADERSRRIYARWMERHQGSDKVTGSRTADMRSALVDYFREEGTIMIATEAGAEGINLQFCSLVVNYDLPWNPQRIEQRIGRCHRYGQKHDVVVVNFVNLDNAADKRVFELLSEKFKLFEGVFGASDEVLGVIESGVDFERRIGEIYQYCRTEEEIKKSFDKLQMELDDVEGETEYFAIKEAFGEPARSGIELQNLAGGIVHPKDNFELKLRGMLEKDKELRRLSLLSIDRVPETAVTFVKGLVKDRLVVGRVFVADPDFEYANFTIEELKEVAARLVAEPTCEGRTGDADAVRNGDFGECTNGEAFCERASKLALVPGIKGERWGRALAQFAMESPEHPETGRPRPFVAACHTAIRCRRADYLIEAECWAIDPETLELKQVKSVSQLMKELDERERG